MDVPTKLSHAKVDAELKVRKKAHASYANQIHVALNAMHDVAIGLMDQENFDPKQMQEIEAIAAEWVDMAQECQDCSEAATKLSTELSRQSEEEIGAQPLPSLLQKYVGDQMTVASRPNHLRTKQAEWMSAVFEESQKGSERFPKGWKPSGSEKSAAEDDDDVIATKSKPIILDPITQKMFVKPVRNPACKHCYEEETIIAYLKTKKGQVKCPVAGCGSHIERSRLERSRSTERLVQREMKLQKNKMPAQADMDLTQDLD